MRWCPLRRDFGHLVWEDLLARGPHWEQVSNINEVKYRCPLFTILPYNKQVAITLSLSLQAFLRSNIITIIITITICHSPTSNKSIHFRFEDNSPQRWYRYRYREPGSGSHPDPESRCATTPVSQSWKSSTKRTTRAKTLDEDTQVGDPDAASSLMLHYRLVCRFWRGSQAWLEGCAESASAQVQACSLILRVQWNEKRTPEIWCLVY
jgi:hypothetical protein